MGSLEFFSRDCGYLVIVIMAFAGLMQSTSYMHAMDNKSYNEFCIGSENAFYM